MAKLLAEAHNLTYELLYYVLFKKHDSSLDSVNMFCICVIIMKTLQ